MIVVALGANLPGVRGETPEETLAAAGVALEVAGVRVVAFSRVWRSAPVPFDPEQPWYYNAVVLVETALEPRALMALLLRVEADFGRVRGAVRNAARVLDLDLIDYHGMVFDTDDLTLPHSRMAERAFVLFPLREVAPDWTHPVRGACVDALIAALGDGQEIYPVDGEAA